MKTFNSFDTRSEFCEIKLINAYQNINEMNIMKTLKKNIYILLMKIVHQICIILIFIFMERKKNI